MKASTKGEGHERRYFYGSVWAVTIAQPCCGSSGRRCRAAPRYDIVKLAVFLGILAVRRQHGPPGAVAAHTADRSRRTRRLRLTDLTRWVSVQSVMRKASVANPVGHEGWDDYAAYYDWENAQTVGRRDIAFWQRMAAPVDGPILELGCGTGPGRASGSPARLNRVRHRSIGIDAGAGAHACSPRASRLSREIDSRRHPPPAVSRSHVPARHGAVRDSAIAAR